MIEVLETDDEILKNIFINRNKESEDLWTKLGKDYKANKKIWGNQPDWLARVPRGRSKTRDNRVFLATESQINKVTSRPVKPTVFPANETDEAKTIAEDLQTVFLEGYRTRGVKKHMKRGLRFLHFSALMVFKVFWNQDTDDFDVSVVDPRKVRFSRNSTNELESEFAIEAIDDKKMLDLLDRFPDKEEEILKQASITKEKALEQNPPVTYHEIWIGDGVFWVYKNELLDKMQSPYHDFQGLLLTSEEMAEIKETQETTEGVREPVRNGRDRREMFTKFKAKQSERRQELQDDEVASSKYESYLFNHHDSVRKPYIFGTILEVENKPMGEVTLIEMVTPLQEGVDQRKRQIADNADFVNGITKVDTDRATIDLADARAMHYDPEGLLYGPGVMEGVSRETGTALPVMVFQDMQDSRTEIDDIFGTGETFKGEQGKTESATGRAILQRQSLTRLDEIVDLVDYIGGEIYNWWMQLIKTRYTETHMTKLLGSGKAGRTIELIQDDIQEGVEIKISSGETLPDDDKIFRAERAREDVTAGIVDPLTYLENAGGYDNPEQIVKRSLMFKTNPFSIVTLDGEDLEKLQEANDILASITPQQEEDEGGDGQSAQKIAEIRERMIKIAKSPEFKKLPPEEQKSTLKQMGDQLKKLGGSNNQPIQ